MARKTTGPASNSTAVARVLRGLGLKQGADFKVRGAYVRGERRATVVAVIGANAEAVVAAHADMIERLTGESGFPFRVDVYTGGDGRPYTTVTTGAGPGVRPTGVVDLLAHL